MIELRFTNRFKWNGLSQADKVALSCQATNSDTLKVGEVLKFKDLEYVVTDVEYSTPCTIEECQKDEDHGAIFHEKNIYLEQFLEVQ